jgi:hypothetical protein
MLIAKIITYASIFVWLLPAIRQYKGKYFYYFLILALSDPLNIFFVNVLNVPNYFFHSIAGILLFYSIGTSTQSFLKYWKFNLLFILVFLFTLFTLPNLLFLILILHVLILSIFIKQSVILLHQSGELNYFLLVLIFYEITVLLKVIVFISGTDTGIMFFYLTLSFQILVALFFTIFREESSILTIKLRTLP